MYFKCTNRISTKHYNSRRECTSFVTKEVSNVCTHLSTRAKYVSYQVLVIHVLAKSFTSAAGGSGKYLIRSGRNSIHTNTTYRCTLRR
jgi:hypothetical protein